MTARELIPTYKRSEYTPSVEVLNNSKNAAEFFRSLYPPDEIELRERFYAAYLTTRKSVIGYRLISIGGINATVVDVRLIIQGALLTNATGIAICHNHPSGNRTPSEQDLILTKKINDAGAVMDLVLLDHVILLPNGDYYSFRDEGKL